MSNAIEFIDERFPDFFAGMASGNDTFLSENSSTANGFEQRKFLGWGNATFQISDVKAIIDNNNLQFLTSYNLLNNLFHVACGDVKAFRFRSPLDFQANLRSGFVGKNGMGRGLPQEQLYKKYFYGRAEIEKKIYLPSNVEVYVDDVYDSRYVANLYNGIISFPALKKFNISSTSNSSTQVTITLDKAHTFLVGEIIYLNISNTNSTLYRKTYPVVAITERTITIDAVNNSALTGTVDMYLQPHQKIRATFEYDYAVRFTTKEFPAMRTGNIVEVQGFTLVEVKDNLVEARK